MKKEKIIIVNEKDEIITHKDRGMLNDSEDIYRCSALWLINSNNKILLAKRSMNKKHNPGKWGPAVAGTNDKGETYEQNIIKEAKEELGLNNFNLIKGPKLKEKGKYNHFTQWFITNVDKNINDFNIQEDEVDKIKWFEKQELLDRIKENPDNFLDRIIDWITMFEKEGVR